MKKTFLLILFSVLGAIFYCILMEGFFYYNIAIGFILSFMGVTLFSRDIKVKFSFKTLWKYIKLGVELFYNIYKSSIIVIKDFFKKSKDVKFIKKECDKDVSAVAQANTITLSPGTVAVDKEQNTLTVLCSDDKKEV